LLFLHEVHKVKGIKEDEFEAAYREGWMPTMAQTDNARLLWYTNHAVGSGVSYNVVTITGLADGAAWEDLAQRIHHGDLQSWMTDLDALRHDVEGKIMLALPWSPMQDLDLATVPTDGAEHELTLYMEDTMWPYEGKYDDYVEISGSVYAKSLGVEEEQFITIELGLQPAFSTHVRNEVALMQKIHDTERLRLLLTSEIPPEHRGPGTWMHDGLALRDQWESRLLRTSSWSPLW
jgi:hypothetical protein